MVALTDLPHVTVGTNGAIFVDTSAEAARPETTVAAFTLEELVALRTALAPIPDLPDGLYGKILYAVGLAEQKATAPAKRGRK